MRVLVIEDNPKMAAGIQRGLREHGYAADACHTGFEGEELAAGGEYDLVVLDLMLPDRDGVEVCRNLRRREIATPVLMLTARDTLDDKIAGLDAGADDYVVKPFELEELDARLRALQRRAGGQMAPSLLSVGDLTLDTGTMQVTRAGQSVSVTPIGLKLLIALLQASPKVVTRRDLDRAVWEDASPDSDALRSHLYNLRKAIDKPFPKPIMHTVAGVGYRLAEVDGE